ncbi:MAG TPA: hypothetical protein VLJ41_00210 [Segetibacter sp.]|nr:hypothetical protein [Segetibacter sp.]
MNTNFTSASQFEIIKFLYQFKDDNKFYKLEEHLLNSESKKETYQFIYNLRDNALISTDREVYCNEDGYYFAEHFNNSEEIRAKILPKGVAVMENLYKEQKS